MGWMRYDDIGTVFELSAVYDDALKKDEAFTNFAVKVANEILQNLGVKAYATYGKWGARLEPNVNPAFSPEDIEEIGRKIMAHPAWEALKLATHIFTFGEFNEEVYEYQAEAENRAQETAKVAEAFTDNLFKKPFVIEAPEDCLKCMDCLSKSIDDCWACTCGPAINHKDSTTEGQ